ncbi:MAG: diguanylate cyclase [Thiovulaceae bacterium]|nr:diguanylate cyclase [Sulfurimonadaceae bacterium]
MKNLNNDVNYKKLLRAPYQLISIMVLVALIVTNASIYGLYKIGFEQQKKRLIEIVNNEAVMINMMINYQLKMDHINSPTDAISQAKIEILDKLMYAHKKFVGFGTSGEYTLGTLHNNKIVFLLSHRHNETGKVNFVPIDSQLAAPMRMALKGKTGTIVGLDYRATEVLAAYEPIEHFKWGIVAKIDTAEIQAPYIQAAIFGFFMSIIVMTIGGFVVIFFTQPLLSAIEKSRLYNRTLFNESPISLVLTDMKGNVLDVNPAFLKLIGYELDEIFKISYWDITPIKYADQEQQQLMSLAQENRYGPYEKEYIHKDGHIVNVRLSGCLLRHDGKKYIWSSIEDITEKKHFEIALQEASLVFEHTHEGIVIADAKNNIIRVNSTFTKVTGFTSQEVLGKNPRFLQSGIHDKNFYKEMWNIIDTKGTWYGEITNKRKNGEYFTTLQSITAVKNDEGLVTGYVSVFSDINDRKKYELQLAHLAAHDNLTSLANRMNFYDNLDKAIQMAKRRQNKIGVLFIDLNHFKEVNDTLGHEIGDQLLKEISLRFVSSVREEDTVARLGGDEFAIILTELKESQDSIKIIHKIIQIVEKPFHINEHCLIPSLSIGISIYPDDGENRDVLLNNADQAMYSIKKHREKKYEFYKELI